MASARVRLFTASFLLLYFELVMSRWVPGHDRVLAYFTSFVLIGSFFRMDGRPGAVRIASPAAALR